ncbi:MAG TPA: laccase domain-containing protein, partial [Burkholderiaceae bacterium]
MTTRVGGASAAPYAGFNLGDHVGDDAQAVAANRAAFARAIGAAPVFLRQAHGARVVRLTRADTLAGALPHEADACVSAEPG